MKNNFAAFASSQLVIARCREHRPRCDEACSAFAALLAVAVRRVGSSAVSSGSFGRITVPSLNVTPRLRAYSAPLTKGLNESAPLRAVAKYGV